MKYILCGGGDFLRIIGIALYLILFDWYLNLLILRSRETGQALMKAFLIICYWYHCMHNYRVKNDMPAKTNVGPKTDNGKWYEMKSSKSAYLPTVTKFRNGRLKNTNFYIKIRKYDKSEFRIFKCTEIWPLKNPGFVPVGPIWSTLFQIRHPWRSPLARIAVYSSTDPLFSQTCGICLQIFVSSCLRRIGPRLLARKKNGRDRKSRTY